MSVVPSRQTVGTVADITQDMDGVRIISPRSDEHFTIACKIILSQPLLNPEVWGFHMGR